MIPVCPKCDVALLLVHEAGVQVDVCERCRGVWLDAGELEQLGVPPAPVEIIAASSKHLCPRCDRPMRQIRRNDVDLEECVAGHGLWLDAGELPRLQAGAVQKLFTKGD